MALFVPGMECVLCGSPIHTAQEKVMFSPFVANRKDPLHLFSDAVFHRGCFENHPLSADAICRHEEVRRRNTPAQRKCVVCHQVILDDYFGTGFLTSDSSSRVYQYNFLHIHRSHFERWERARDFQRDIEMFQSSDPWEGPVVKFDPRPSWAGPQIRSQNRSS